VSTTKRNLEFSCSRLSPEAILVDFQRPNLRFQCGPRYAQLGRSPRGSEYLPAAFFQGGLNHFLLLRQESSGKLRLVFSIMLAVTNCSIAFRSVWSTKMVRSIVCGVVGPCKTESSQKPVPVHPTVLEELRKWRELSRYNKAGGWVFASRRHRRRKPIWGQAILRKYIRPAAQKVGIRKQFGWHTFRHTYSTLLRSVGTEFKVMQELLRHSSFRSTLDVYTQAISPAKHAAQAAVLAQVFTAETNTTGSSLNATS
jgi:hypothetical protein